MALKLLAEFLSSPEPYRSINRRNTHMFANDGYTIVNPSKNADSITPGMDLEPTDYAWMTRQVQRVANVCCNGRVVSLLNSLKLLRVVQPE